MPRQYRDNLRFERSADTAEWICGGAGSSRQDKRHGRAPCRRRCVHGGHRGACRSPRRPSKDEPGRGGKYIRAARGTPGLNMLCNDNPRPKKEFRLGFDTATEVSLLRIAATQGSRRLFSWAITVFPILFSAGISLIDIMGGHLMLSPYGWASFKPLRKIYYNLTITLEGVWSLSQFAATKLSAQSLLGSAFELSRGEPSKR